ncbi:MAG: hypothetical protein ABIH63_04425 [archaeon]
MTFDEAKFREVSDLVRSLPIDWEDFDLFNTSYAVRAVPSKNEDGSPNGSPAEYDLHENGQCGIYLWEDIGEKKQRPLLFHEMVEIYHKVALDMSKIEAHNTTMPWEKRFCLEYLTPSELAKYLKFKKEHGCNGFDLSNNK